MIRISTMPDGTVSAIGRVHIEDDAGVMADYDLLFMLNWIKDDPNSEVWIHGLIGKVSLKALRELVSKLNDMGFRYIRAFRVEHRKLPKAKLHPDGGLVIDIWDFMGPGPKQVLHPEVID